MMSSRFKKIIDKLKFHDPIENIIKILKEKNIDLSSINAIELFNSENKRATDLISREVKSITLVEYDPYIFLKYHKERYHFIISDNPIEQKDTNFQHFSLFPDIFNIFENRTILLLNIVQDFKKLEKESKLESIKIGIEQMCKAYEKLGRDNGFKLVEYFTTPKNRNVDYLCLIYQKEKNEDRRDI